MLDNGLMIEDFSDFSLNGMYGELVDEAILEADRTKAKISIFVPEEKSLSDYEDFINKRLTEENIPYSLECEGMEEDDWAESWKSYFEPIKLGRVTIVPSWEEYDESDGEVVIRIDPGMAFGTGAHETTRLVMKILQDVACEGDTVLDVGCGSGILSICAAKLGASECYAYDIDPVAVKVARENVKDSGCRGITVGESDLLRDVYLPAGGYDLCVANIVAEIILRMLPDAGAYLKPHAPIILSGIVKEKAGQIKDAAASLGYELIREEAENDWVALMIRR
jgi:ribosomal protein L11 methyltransferase